MMAEHVLLVVGVIVLAALCRAAYYRTIFGRFVFRLRPEENERLVPANNQAAYHKGYEDGKRAALEGSRSDA